MFPIVLTFSQFERAGATSYFLVLLPNESSTPITQSMANTRYAEWKVLMISAVPASLIRAPPNVKYMIMVRMAMLNCCPTNLIVLKIEFATAESFGAIEDMTAVVFGDEKTPKPMPASTRLRITRISGESSRKKIKNSIDNAQIAIPTEEMMNGERLSESHPASGETRAMLAGCTMRINPAISGWKPRMIIK